MALIKSVRGFTPKYGDNCYLAENATLVGQIEMGNDCSVWFNAVVRGDVNSIKMGNKVNIQDGAVIHGTYERAATVMGDNVSVGHNAIIHGATIKDNVLVGMGAIIMDNAVIEENCLIAAGSVVLANTHVPSGTLFGGVPAKKIKDLSPELFEGEVSRIANNYLLYSSWFK
jgi:carbonic anhydrase/acetyltransferase-like protein (isoleucine patch superfamily)